MPRPKKRDSAGSSNKSSKKKRRTLSDASSESASNCDVVDILDCRIAPKSISDMEFFVSWYGFDESHNSWEPYDNLRMNTKLLDFVKDTFAERELEIYVTVANIKERIKKRIRKSLRTKKKMEIMMEVYPFDPKEYRTTLAFYHHLNNPPKEFQEYVETFVYRSYFFEMEKMQRIKHDKFVEKIKEIDPDIELTIENDDDFELLPEFEYITKNFLADEFNATMMESPEKPSKPPKGCSCGDKCSRLTDCCPKIVNEPFPYKKDKKDILLKFKEMEKIYECGDNCNCDINCINRVSQRTPDVKLCVFKTLNYRGWGVKALSKIREGAFITEYRGELLGHHEAGKRSETCYLFDLNMDRQPNGFYTLDAHKFGSIARFVNHSCEPNAKMWFINDCGRDPKSQKLCIFADRDIEADEEITIDYSPKDCIPVSDRLNMSYSLVVDCKCGTLKCRGTIY